MKKEAIEKLEILFKKLDEAERMAVSCEKMEVRDYGTWRRAFFDRIERIALECKGEARDVMDIIAKEWKEKGGDA